jgi:hypothetical protein
MTVSCYNCDYEIIKGVDKTYLMYVGRSFCCAECLIEYMDRDVQVIAVDPPTPEELAKDSYDSITQNNKIDQQFRIGYMQGMQHFAEAHDLRYDWLK